MEATHVTQAVVDAPTARFYGWRLVAVFWVGLFINVGFAFYGAGVLNSYMAADLHLDRKTLGLAFTIAALASGLSAPLVSVAVNRLGIRRTFAFGGALLTAGSLALALVVRTGWQAVLVFGLVIGLGQGFGGPIPVQTGVTLWFKRRRALALSLTIMSAGVGGFVAAPSLNKLVASLGGDWRKGWLVIAVLAALSTLSTLLFVRDRPSDLGQEPDGGDAPAANAMNHGGVGVKPPRVHKETGDWTMAQVVRTPVFWIIMFGAVASTAGYSLLLAHGVIHFKGLGLSAEAAAMSLGLLTLCSIIGKMVFGALGDRIEPRFIWSASLLLFVAGVLLAVKATTPAQVYAYALLAGAGFGAGFLAFMTLLGNYYGPKAYASVLGVTILIIAVANSIGPFVAGLAYDHLGSYALALQISGGIALVGAIGVLFALPPKRVHR